VLGAQTDPRILSRKPVAVGTHGFAFTGPALYRPEASTDATLLIERTISVPLYPITVRAHGLAGFGPACDRFVLAAFGAFLMFGSVFEPGQLITIRADGFARSGVFCNVVPLATLTTFLVARRVIVLGLVQAGITYHLTIFSILLYKPASPAHHADAFYSTTVGT
jgi:hypothetical protein